MIHRRPRILCVVEKGWQGMRLFSRDAAGKGYFVRVLIKGYVQREVLDMITKYPLIDLVAVRRIFFRLILFVNFLKDRAQGLKYLVMDKDRTINWMRPIARPFGVECIKLYELNGGYRLEGGDSI